MNNPDVCVDIYEMQVTYHVRANSAKAATAVLARHVSNTYGGRIGSPLQIRLTEDEVGNMDLVNKFMAVPAFA